MIKQGLFKVFTQRAGTAEAKSSGPGAAIIIFLLLYAFLALSGLPEWARFYLLPAVATGSILGAYLLGTPALFPALALTLAPAAALASRMLLAEEAQCPISMAILLYSAAGTLVITLARSRENSKHRNLEWISSVDSLTEVHNHRYFQQRLAEELARAGRSGSPVSLVFMDIDHFKEYNDLNGHVMGDKALKRTAAFLDEETRIHDIVCRYGGDEFVIILPDTGCADAALIARRVVEGYTELLLPSSFSRRVELTLSAGVSTYPRPGRNMDDLISQADHALYLAKREGKNRVCLFGEEAPGQEIAEALQFCLSSCEQSLVESYRALSGRASRGNGGTHGGHEPGESAPGNGSPGNGNGNGKSRPENRVAVGRALGIGHANINRDRLALCLDETGFN